MGQYEGDRFFSEGIRGKIDLDHDCGLPHAFQVPRLRLPKNRIALGAFGRNRTAVTRSKHALCTEMRGFLARITGHARAGKIGPRISSRSMEAGNAYVPETGIRAAYVEVMKRLILICLTSVGLVSFVGCSCDKSNSSMNQTAPMQTDTKSMQSPSH